MGARTEPWSKGGVYSEEELKSLRDYMEFSRYKEYLGYQLTRQLRRGSPDLAHDISLQQLFPGDPGILSYVMGFLFSFGNTASVFIGAYILYTFAHKVIVYFYKVLVLREALGWTKEILFCCCSDFLQMRKYRADYRTAKANEAEYGARYPYRRPPSEGADSPNRTIIWSEWRLTVIAATVRIALVDILDLSEVDIPAGGFL